MVQGRARKRVLTIIAVIAGAICVWQGWLWYGNKSVITPSSQPEELPSPNAFDTYAEAGKLLDDSAPGKMPDVPKPAPLPGNAGVPRPEPPDYTAAEMRALLKANAAALAKVRKGIGQRCVVPLSVSLSSSSFPEFSKCMELARLLVVESRVKVMDGDFAGAMDSCIDAVKLGNDLSRGGDYIHALVGIATQAIGRIEAFKLVDRLSVNEAAAAAVRMETIHAEASRPAQMLAAEKAFGLNHLAEIFASPYWRKKVVEPNELELEMMDGKPGIASRVRWWFQEQRLTKVGVMGGYSRMMDKLIQRTKASYPVARKMRAVRRPPWFADIINYSNSIGCAFARRDTEDVLLTTALALRAYRGSHGDYPATLVDLAPDYLKEVPGDPFADREPLRYKRSDDSYILYSIGPDCKDDGGRPISKPAGIAFGPNDKGDVVYRPNEKSLE